MTYQIKDQDVTPPPRDPELARSAMLDGIAALAIALITAGLIALVVGIQIL